MSEFEAPQPPPGAGAATPTSWFVLKVASKRQTAFVCS